MGRGSAMDRLMRGGEVGDIEIGAEAGSGQIPQSVVYQEKQFTKSELVDVSVYDGVSIAPGTTHAVAIQVNAPFKPHFFTVPSWQAPGLAIQSITIGPLNLIDLGSAAPAALAGVPADRYTEVATDREVEWPTLQTAQPAVIVFVNDSLAAITPRCVLTGKRVRD